MSVKQSLRDLEQRVRLALVRPLRIKLAARKRAQAPGVFIGITGSSGKSSTTDLIAAVLRRKGSVTTQLMNNTINPLINTIRNSGKSDFVVVENGVGEKGVMKPMASLLQPDIAVVTMVGLEHYSAFRSSEAIAEEKGWLVESLRPEGLAVLNADDPLVMGMARRTSARVLTFGYSEDADCRIVKVEGGAPSGIVVTLSYRGQELVIPTKYAGHHFAASVAAATIVGMQLGVTVEDLRDAIGSCSPVVLRLSTHQIAGGPLIIADCAKAPLGTLHLAFDALRHVDAPRKRIVLAQVSDYIGSRMKAYRTAFGGALAVADELIFVTDRSRPERFLPRDDKGTQRFKHFLNTREAAEYLAATAMEGEVILLKGSQRFHLERILINFQQPVRCWEESCGRGGNCFSCGMAGFDFQSHRPIARKRRRRRFLGKLFGRKIQEA